MENRCLSRRERDGKPMRPVLPDQIIEDILSRLPAKSLLRFSSVSKQWLCLISDPIFIQSQLKHVLSDQHYSQHQKLMITSYDSSQFYSVDYESLNCNQVQLQNLPFSAPYGVTILGSCNGLLCIGIHSEKGVCYDAIIWNPLFKNYKRVSRFFTSGWEWDSVLLGFGYDSLTDEYKFVKVYNKRHQGEVYSMKSNSWRSLSLESDLSGFYFSDVGTYFNGYIYWVDVPMLIEFDLKNEKFRLVKLPIHRSVQVIKLFVVKGRLGVFATSYHYEFFTLFMMKEDSCNVRTWSQVNILGPERRSMGEAICLKTNGEIVMRIKNDWSISSDEEELVSEKDGPVHEAPATSESGKVLMQRVLPMQQDLCYSRDDLIIYNPLEETVKKGPIGGARDSSEYTIYIETLVSLHACPNACAG